MRNYFLYVSLFIINFVLVFMLFISSLYLRCQTIELNDVFVDAIKLFKEKNYSETLKSNKKAIKLSYIEYRKKYLTTGNLYENKSRLQVKLKEFNDAGKIFEKVYPIRKKILRPNEKKIAEALNCLSLSFRMKKKYLYVSKVHIEY